MTTAQDYINQVIDCMPRATPSRAQIAAELGGNIAERVGHGQTLDEVLRNLGDPAKLAESYLAAVPLVPASFLRRAAAKLVDVLSAVCVIVPLTILTGSLAFAGGFGFLAMFAIVILILGEFCFAVYVIVAESKLGKTLGKHLLGLRVVQESGTRITIGQSIVRQLPLFLQVFWIDVFFALFTERKQRAFELLSKTRVVLA